MKLEIERKLFFDDSRNSIDVSKSSLWHLYMTIVYSLNFFVDWNVERIGTTPITMRVTNNNIYKKKQNKTISIQIIIYTGPEKSRILNRKKID